MKSLSFRPWGAWSLLPLLTTLAVHPLQARQFDSGSTGSYGPLHITANTTLEMPPDGVFHCTTIHVAAGAVLRFNPNARNTPVRLLATGDVVIAGIINVSGHDGSALQGGLGGPGGFAGGNPGRQDLPPSSGHGPGGGPPGADLSIRHGVFGSRPDDAPPDLAQPYGNSLLIPLIGGSGGGGSPARGGGGGGGAILIASSSLIRLEATGQIQAQGGDEGMSSLRSVGSGGAIRLVAPRVMGAGASAFVAILNVRDGRSGSYFGRIRIDSTIRAEGRFTFQPEAAASLGAFMTLEPAPLPRLELVRAAGQDLAPDSGPVYLELPFGSPASQEIEVQARDFNAVVPVRIRLVPEAGAAFEYPVEIDNRTLNPARTTVSVQVPPNVRTTVEVWTAAAP